MTNTGIVVRTWNDAPISRRDSDGYADATAMCQANGKLWADYQRLSRTTDYITALADAIGLGPDQLIISTKGGPAHLQGTWIHPRLAVDLARWISPAFAVWMDGWFLENVAVAKSLTPQSQPLSLGVKVCAPDLRHATEFWREAVKREVISALNQALPVTGISANAGPSNYPALSNCDWVKVPTPQKLGIDQIRSVLTDDSPVTTTAILHNLNLNDSRCNQMVVAGLLKCLGYTRGRHMTGGIRQWMFFPPGMHPAVGWACCSD